jgi:predicted Zn-dependent protease
MEISHHRTERFYLKLFFGGFVVVVILVAIFWGGHDLYARWQERRLIRKAIYRIQHDDTVSAGLAARTVLEIKPDSVPAARIMAEVGEKTGSRVALDWRRRAVEFAPNSLEDRLAWARCALRFGELSTAENALSQVDENGKQTAGYHAVAGLLAQAKREPAVAISEWQKAVQLEPNETAYRLQLGIAEANSKDEQMHKEGKAMLQQLRADLKQRAEATRALIANGVARREDGSEVISLARELQDYPEATLSDKLSYLDFLHQAQSNEFTSYLSDLETKLSDNPTDLTALLEWMSENNLNLLAIDFVKTIPPATLDKWPLPLAKADIYARLKEWRKLEEVTRDANWRQGEFLRHAYLARALRGEDKPAAAEHEWGAATREASNQSQSVLALVRVTAEWKWDNEMRDLLWGLTKDPEKQRDAVQTLYQQYSKANDTQGLYRVLARWSEIAPDDLDIQNNFAQVGLLLNANPDDARRIAAEVYRKNPSNPAYATTYAYSLLSKGNAPAAAKVMSSLTQEQLRDPSISAYYGICLAAVHDAKARDFLEAGESANLLPEEKALVAKALDRLPKPQSTVE